MNKDNFPHLQSMGLAVKLERNFSREYLAQIGIQIYSGIVIHQDTILYETLPEPKVLTELRDLVRQRKDELGLYLAWAHDI